MRRDVDLTIEGMNCSHCAVAVEKRLQKLGAERVDVDFASSRARFSLPAAVGIDVALREIELLGYRARAAGSEAAAGRLAFLTSLEAKVAFCAVWTLPLLLPMFAPIHALHDPYVQLLLCLPVFVVGALHFGTSALGSLRARVPNMDVLVILGIVAAFAYSLYGTLRGLGADYLFYETAASITTLILTGNLLEKRSVKKTTSAVEELSRMQPPQARLIIGEQDGERFVDVPAAEIKRGDRVLVNTGDSVPVDGRIYWGEALIDEAIISGESVPVEKVVGQQVVGGTTLQKGSIKIVTEAVGSDTALAHIIRLVNEARLRKPAIQRIGDTVAAVFVPVVLIIAALTVLVSYFAVGIPFHDAVIHAVAVLVIACPCAMGLATPTAVMVGIGRAAKSGILMKGGSTMEQLAKTKRIVFDKTGTLTTGRFRIKRLEVREREPEFVKGVILGLERHSSHPIAQSLTKELQNSVPRELHGIEEHKGLGLKGRDAQGNLFEVGSYSIARQATADSDHEIYVLQNGELIGWLDVEDELKSEAEQAVRALKGLGIETVMLSGDREKKCRAVAERLGIDRYHSEMLPQQKLQVIEQLSSDGITTFVGDGVNDAPSLARATVGVSLSTATRVAIDSAQIVLLNGDLNHLVNALRISRLTLRTIKQNLFWAFFYNVLAIPGAAAGYLSPIIAALAMAISDTMVIGNSLRLKIKKVSS